MGTTVRLQPTSGHDLRARLDDFERRYQCTSDTFYKAFMNGDLDETEDFLDWSILYSAHQIASTGYSE